MELLKKQEQELNERKKKLADMIQKIEAEEVNVE